MNKRTFLKLSGLLAATPFISALRNMHFQEKLTNWAGNLVYSTSDVHYPHSLPEIQQLVRKFDQIKALGSRHCFNTIADSSHHLLSMKELNKVVSLDKQAKTVTVEGGMNYGQLCPWLHENGFALPNLASLPHISVAGAVTTATHGSGVENGNLATVVRAMEFIAADGSVVTLSAEKDGDRFFGAVVGLGAIGVITKLTLAVQPAYEMFQRVYEELPLAQLRDNFDRILSSGYSVSLFTDWQRQSINEVWVKSRGTEKPGTRQEFFGARPAVRNVHPIIDLSAENCTEQMGVAGPWYERLPHFRMGFTPSSGKELQTEYFVPRRNGFDAFMAVQKMGPEIGPHLFISEIRTIAEDTLWLSPAYRQDCVAIHFTWKQDWPAVSKLLPKIERELLPYGVKPHWGKLFTITGNELASRYERWDDFRKLAAGYDPKGKFRNEFLNKTIFS